MSSSRNKHSPIKNTHNHPITQQDILQQIQQLSQTLRDKNQIIEYLTSRIKNQQQQIDMLVTDAESKHFHEIKKHYARSYDKYLKSNRAGRYLLIKIDSENDDNGIYLPKGVKIVHFAQLDWDNQAEPKPTHAQSQGGIDTQPKLNGKKPSVKLQTSCKGLSQQLQAFKNKLLQYSQIVTANSAMRQQQMQQSQHNDGSGEQKVISDFSIKAKDSYIKDLQQKLKEMSTRSPQVQKNQQKSVEKSKDKDNKKKHTSKTYFIRKY